MAPVSAAQKRKYHKLQMRQKRATETAEEIELRREKDRERKRKIANIEEITKEKKQRLAKDRHAKRIQRVQEKSEMTIKRHSKDKVRQHIIRAEETPEKTEQRKTKDRVKTSMARADEKPEKTEQRKTKDRFKTSMARADEKPEKTAKRLKTVKASMTKLRADETPDNREQRMTKDRVKTRITRSDETPEKRGQRRTKDRVKTCITRTDDTPEKREPRKTKDRLKTHKARMEETPAESRTRCNNVRESMKILRNKKRVHIPHNDVVVADFLNKVRDAADYVCCSCHRMMYRLGVQLLKQESYTKITSSMLNDVFSHKLKSAHDKEWICRNCHVTLKRGNLPSQAKCNNLELTPLPKELSELNNLELRMISQRIPFVKMVALPRGKQHGIHGPAVNVPSKLDFVCAQFPRLPSETQLVPMKLKRRLKYKSHYMYEYVRPQKVLTALRWLIKNNKLYANITINDNWLVDSNSDDPELWNAMTSDKTVVTDENLVEEEVSNCPTLVLNESENAEDRFDAVVENETTYEIISASEATILDQSNRTNVLINKCEQHHTRL